MPTCDGRIPSPFARGGSDGDLFRDTQCRKLGRASVDGGRDFSLSAGDNRRVVAAIASEERALCERLLGGGNRLTPGQVAAACRHRVHLLVADSLSAEERMRPETVELARELRVAAAFDLRSGPTIGRLLQAFATAGVDALLMKGAGFAHTVYSASYPRARARTDGPIREIPLERAERALI